MRRYALTTCLLAVAALLILTSLACTDSELSEASPAADVYVSVKGSDSTGDSTETKPWRHIQYAVDHAKQPSGTVLTVHLLKGIYKENLVIKRPLTMIGAGVGPSTSWPNDPLTPVQDVSVINRQNPNSGQPGILIQDATSVNLQNLDVFGGGLRAVNTRFILYNVEVQQTIGSYGVQIEDCFVFYLQKTKILTGDGLESDVGLDIRASDGDVLDSYLGDFFDHVININPNSAKEQINPNTSYQPHSVTIRDSEIAGSNIAYADGIRMQGATYLRVANTKITRTHPDNVPATDHSLWDPPYAAIQLAGYLSQANIQGKAATRVDLDGVTTSGFDVGIGVGVESMDVVVKNSAIAAVTHDVETTWVGYTGTVYPRVDFGGGPLSSVGQNSFATTAPYAFYHTAPYAVSACHNSWGVPTAQVDATRIYDKLDASASGRVTWDCA
jgi:hypothetical protein